MFLKCLPSCILCSTCAIFELTYCQLGANFRQLGLTWSRLGPTWGQLVPTWGSLGANLNQLGANLVQLGVNVGELGANFGHPQHFASDFAAEKTIVSPEKGSKQLFSSFCSFLS